MTLCFETEKKVKVLNSAPGWSVDRWPPAARKGNVMQGSVGPFFPGEALA